MSETGSVVDEIVDSLFDFYLPLSAASRYVKTEPITRFFDELGKARRQGLDDATAKDLIAGSLYGRILRLTESTGSNVLIRKYGEPLRESLERFINVLFLKVFIEKCKENFAEARRFGRDLRHAVLLKIDSRLNQEWERWKKEKEGKS